MGAGASVSDEAELSTFKEMRAKFEASPRTISLIVGHEEIRAKFEELKDAGMTDEDIYTELKALYNAISTPTSDATVASEDAKITAATPAGAAGATVAAADTPAERPGAAGADASEAADAPAEGGGEAAVPPAAVE